MSDYQLYAGDHSVYENKRCAMEWVSYLAGEPHSDAPKCVQRSLRLFFIGMNDALNHTERQLLRPYLTRTVGTKNDGVDRSKVYDKIRCRLRNRDALYSSPRDYMGLGDELARAVEFDEIRPYLEELLPLTTIQTMETPCLSAVK